MKSNRIIAQAFVVLVLTTSLLGCLAAAGHAEGSKTFAYPETRAGFIAKEFVEGFSSGSDSVVTRFHGTYLSAKALEEHPLKQQLWRYHHLYDILGTLSPQAIVENSESNLVLLVKSEQLGSFFHVGLTLDEATPKMLAEFYIRPAPKPQ